MRANIPVRFETRSHTHLPLNILQLESRCVIDEQSGLFHCVKGALDDVSRGQHLTSPPFLVLRFPTGSLDNLQEPSDFGRPGIPCQLESVLASENADAKFVAISPREQRNMA